MSLTAVCSFDIDSEGRHCGYIRIGDSTNSSGWAYHSLPITSVKNGAGVRLLILGGNHGDEYEGQIAALDLARRLQVEDVRGQIIIIPVLSLAASASGTRLWPDGTNFNRVFPGKVDGTIAEKLAFYLSHDLFPTCDVVVDMHSGGRSMYFIPSSNMGWIKNLPLRDVMARHMLSWKSQYHMIGGDQPSTNPDSLLPGDVVRQGKAVSTGEFGGSGWATAESLEVIRVGLENFMRGIGVYIVGKESVLSDFGKIIDSRDPLSFVTAPAEGIYENTVDLYDHVTAGDIVGRIHNFKQAGGEVIEVRARRSGIIAVIRGYPPVTIGDVVCYIGALYNDFDSFQAQAASEVVKQ